MNIIYKTKLKFWYNIKKGYIKFFKSKGLEEYRSFKQDLFLVRINHKELPFDLIEQKDINKTLIQYVNQKLFDNYFFYVFLFFFNKKKKIIFPIPKEFNNVLKKYNYEVNFFLSNILWKVFTILQMLNGFKEIIVLLFSSIKFRNSKKIHQNYSIYPNFNSEKLNLGSTKESNSKLYNVVRWCDDYFSNSYSVFFSKKKMAKHNFFVSYKGIEHLFSYKLNSLKTIIWCIKVFLLSLYWLITLDTWRLLILPEIVKAGYIKFSKQKFPKNIFFIWTNNHYRPLWTYEFKSEDKIKMIFVGSINGLILKGEKTLTKNDFEGLSVATWPSYYAWHEEHGNYIKERIQHSSEIINLNNQVYLKDTDNKLNLPRNSIAVFGYEANRIIMGYSTLADYDIENKDLLENFYKNIYDVLSKNKVYLIIKRKKKLGNMERRKDRKFFSDFQKKEYVKFINEDFAVEKIINSTLATVSMPFTSTGFIAKKMNKPSIFYDSTNWINLNDPSSLGLDVINNKEKLNQWVRNLC